MLWLGDHLVVDVVNVSLDRDVLGLSSDLSVGACCTITSGSGALIVVSIVLSCLKLLQSDDWTNGRVVSEPRMIANLMQLHSLLCIRL